MHKLIIEQHIIPANILCSGEESEGEIIAFLYLDYICRICIFNYQYRNSRNVFPRAMAFWLEG